MDIGDHIEIENRLQSSDHMDIDMLGCNIGIMLGYHRDIIGTILR